MNDNALQSVPAVFEELARGPLRGAMVQDVDLSREGLASLEASDVTLRRLGLHGADATGSDYARVKLTECSCRGADWSGSLLRGCSFFSTELIEARFADTTMSGTSFYNSHLGNADFTGSRLQSVTFNSCELFGVRFARSLLLNTTFEAQERGNVTLDRAGFEHAVLIDCDLLGANLFGANFDHALLVKVDLRHANLMNASFAGAHLIDVQVDLTQLEPAQRREIEAARVEDPWRRHGFMSEVLATYSGGELMRLIEYVIRTYVIEGAQPTEATDTFAGLLAQLKARHDFPELDALRVRGAQVQARCGRDWFDLRAGQAMLSASGEAPEPAGAETTPDGPAAPSMPEPARPAAQDSARPEPAAATNGKAKPPPKGVGTSKRFRRLEMD